ncbi:MAG: cytochrome c peroxidase [Bacteroidia bacterium]
MKKQLYVLMLLALMIQGFSLMQSVFEKPEHFPAPVYDFEKNPLSADKILLGRVLFYDPILSRNNTISCSSCHSPYNAFAHVDHDLSHGIEDRIGTRNAPALMNLAWQKNFMWDGAINHLDMQALAPISHPKEMDENMEHVVLKLKQSSIYPALFAKAFGDSLITGQRILLALSQFQLTFVSSASKYDSVMTGKAKFTMQEKSGYRLFRKHCNACHREPLFSNYEFRNNGLPVDTSLNDMGRMKITQKSEDSLLFKVPTLRNVEYSYPYMHDGRFKTLHQVMNHYSGGIQNSPTLSKELYKAIHLSAEEKVDIVAFLLTLSDRRFIFNPAYSFPKNILLPGAKVR